MKIDSKYVFVVGETHTMKKQASGEDNYVLEAKRVQPATRSKGLYQKVTPWIEQLPHRSKAASP